MKRYLAIFTVFFLYISSATVNAEEDIIRSDIRNTYIKNDVKKLEVILSDEIKRTRFPMNEIQEEQSASNETTEFAIFENLSDTEKDFNSLQEYKEYSLFNKIYNMQAERTSIPAYLLQDELTFKPKKGIVDKVQFFGAYNGNFGMLFTGTKYNNNYDAFWANIGAAGTFKDKSTDFKVQFNFLPAENRNYIQNLVTDAYVVYNKIPNHKIMVGNSRNQVGVDGGASAYTQPFVLRSQIGRTFGNTRALGVRIVGNYSLADYSLALNSSDRFFKSFFPGTEFTGWVNVKPLGKTDGRYGKLTIGGGLNAGHNHNDYTVAGAYIGYSYKKFMANAEFSTADGYNGVYLSNKRASGFYTTVGYKITPKVQVLARFDRFNPDKNTIGNSKTEYTAGLNYFIKGQALRLIFNYVFCQNDNAKDSHRIIVGTQIML